MTFHLMQAKREVRKIMSAARPRPVWITLFYLVHVALVTYLIMSVVTVLSAVGVLTSKELLVALFTKDYSGLIGGGSPLVGNTGPVLSAVPVGTVVFLAAVVLVGNLLLTLWTGAMRVGYADYTISMVNGENPGVDKLFVMFHRLWSILGTQLLVMLFVVLWVIPFTVVFVILVGAAAALTLSGMPAILSTLLNAAGTVILTLGVIWATLRYAMIPYVIADKGVTGLPALRESKRLMKGNLIKYVILHLTFLLWYIPGMIGSYMLTYYMSTLAGQVGADLVAGVFDASYLQDAVKGLVGLILIALALVLIQFILQLYVTPYRFGTEAKFYLCAAGRDGPAGQEPAAPTEDGRDTPQA